MAQKKTKSSGSEAYCPGCAKTPEEAAEVKIMRGDPILRLRSSDGTYHCAQGHTYTIDQLREALATTAKPSETSPADRPEIGDSAEPAEAASESGKQAENEAEKQVLEIGFGARFSPPFTVSETGQETSSETGDLSGSQDNTGTMPESGSSHQPDDLGNSLGNDLPISTPKPVAALLPNGDMLVSIPIPEAMVGPVVELAKQEGKTADEWVAAVFGFWLEDYFSVPAAR